jgi:hypothetical protein
VELSGITYVSAAWEAAVDRKFENEIDQIEATQGMLRESIEEARKLAEQADRLLKTHKANFQDQADRAVG